MSLRYRSFFKEDSDDELPGEPFWGDAGAGALFLAKDTGRFLVFLRSDGVNEPGTWNLVGGKLDYGENAKEAVAREVEEETGYSGEYKMTLIHTFRHKSFRYDNFLVIVPFEFTPQLNWEHDKSKWVEYEEWPSPLHFGLADVIKHAGSKLQRIVAAIKNHNAHMAGEKTNPQVVENFNKCEFTTHGLVDNGIYGYEMRTPTSRISYGYEPTTKTFYLYNIMTPNTGDRNKGYAKSLLEDFFQLVKHYGGALDVEPYTAAGLSYIKHVVERLSKQYGVRLVKGRKYDRS